MRLINATTLKLHTFTESTTPPYAILSHTWLPSTDEPTHQDLLHSPTSRSTTSKKGFAKIRKCAEEAKDHNLDWIWVDTVCIDKTSSAELTEAINSMYAWYRGAEMCFAYLADVKGAGRDVRWEGSKWFTRGWTLQELIAPRNLCFYSTEWEFMFDKTSAAANLSSVTGIPVDVLTTGDPSGCSIAQRMSWAASRITTRTEDIAYCLLGLFDANMPLLYGEGKKAFIRLQEELIRNSMDHSILAWKFPSELEDPSSYCSGPLADSPERFVFCGQVVEAYDENVEDMDEEADIIPFSMTNLGLSITLPCTDVAPGIMCAKLACRSPAGNVSILLRLLRKGIYARIPDRPRLEININHLGLKQVTIASRFLTSTTRLRHFHEAHTLKVTSSDFSLKYVYMTGEFHRPKRLFSGTSPGAGLPFPKSIPLGWIGVWFAVVVGNFHQIALLFGIDQTVGHDRLWCKYVDLPLSDGVDKQIKIMEDLADTALRSTLSSAIGESRSGLQASQSDTPATKGSSSKPRGTSHRSPMFQGPRFVIATDYTPHDFRATDGSAILDERARSIAETRVTVQCRPEIIGHRLIVRLHIACHW